MPDLKLIKFKTKELLTYHCVCRGNLVSIEATYASYPKEAPCQIQIQHQLEQISYKADVAISTDVTNRLR